MTLMRTNLEENIALGKILAEKANRSRGPVAFVLPLRGLSILDGAGQPFCDWETNQTLFDTIRQYANPDIPILKVDANINDDLFAKEAVELLLKIMRDD